MFPVVSRSEREQHLEIDRGLSKDHQGEFGAILSTRISSLVVGRLNHMQLNSDVHDQNKQGTMAVWVASHTWATSLRNAELHHGVFLAVRKPEMALTDVN